MFVSHVVDTIVLVELPSIEITSVNTSVCSASVRWSTSRSDTCGPIKYTVQLLKDGTNMRSLTTNTTSQQIFDLVPSTNYTITVKVMGSGKVEMTKFGTDIISPAGMCTNLYHKYTLW